MVLKDLIGGINGGVSGGEGTLRVSGRPELADPVPELIRRAGPILTGWVVPFALIVYLGLKSGGYDIVARSQVAIAVWWLLLLSVAVGILPSARLPRAAWVGLALFGGFVLWTALGIGWSSSSERSVASLGLVGAYLGFFVFGLIVQRRDAARHMVNAVAAALAVIAILALLSRLHPAWFPPNPFSGKQFVTGRSRLNYPLGYWNGVAALCAMAIPLVLLAASRARTLVARGVAAAAVPAIALALFYTFSRGGAIEVGVAVVVLVALFRRRVALLATLLVDAVATTILITAALQRHALENGLLNGAAHSQGNEMLAMVIVVCAGAGFLQVAIAAAERNGYGLRVPVSGRRTRVALGVAAVAAVAVGLAIALPPLRDGWRTFKHVSVGRQPTAAQRFGTAAGNGRYQLWSAAANEDAADPVEGGGPGTFQYWWNEHGDEPFFVQNAHSLYLETLGELGIVGLVLIAAFIVWVIGRGAERALRGWPGYRSRFAAVTASAAAFAMAAGIDWVWQLAVIPAAFLLLAAVVLGADAVDPRRHRRPRTRGIPLRLGIAVAAILATFAIGIPLAATQQVRASQAAARDGDLGAALDAARSAHSVEPYAASPLLQEAQVLELQRRFGAAADVALQATRAEATNWRTWLIASRIEIERGRASAALADYRRAQRLDSRSLLFQTFNQLVSSVSAAQP